MSRWTQFTSWTKRAISRFFLFFPLALGWMGGFAVRCLRLARAALVEGFHLGNNP